MKTINIDTQTGEVTEIEVPDLPLQEPQLSEQDYSVLVEQRIREKYSASDEFAILRQRDSKPEEFQEYDNFCEEVKAEAKEMIK